MSSQHAFSPKSLQGSFYRDVHGIQAAEQSRRWARELMSEHCTNDNGLRKPSTNTHKEATAVLARVAEGSLPYATVDLVQALLGYGAEICFTRRKSSNLLKMVRNKDQTDIRSNLLERATKNCSHDILLLLAPHADEEALNQALPTAIIQNDLEKVKILLARGADASPLCDEFLGAVESGSDEIIDILTKQVTGACPDCRNIGLIRAAEMGHTAKVLILLNKGADPTFHEASALCAAIRNRKRDIAKLIISHEEIRLRKDLLDLAVGQAYAHSQYQALNECLNAGASGPAVNMTLLHAVKHGQLELVDALIRHNASVEYQGGDIVVFAVKTKQPKILQSVLRNKATKPYMAEAIDQATKLGDIRATHQMVNLLLSAGLRGDAVSEALVQILDKKLMPGDENARLEPAYILLNEGGADVNFHKGRPLVVAATEKWVDIFNLLIQYRPSVESLSAAIEAATKLEDPRLRKNIIVTVFGAVASNISAVEILRGVAVVSAAKFLRLDILEYLAESEISVSTVLAGFSAAVSSKGQWTSPSGLAVIQFLLDNGATGVPVDDAFCQATILFERDAVDLLGTATDLAVFNRAFRNMVAHSQGWLSPDDRNIWLVQSLLEWGVKGEPVNLAFLKALSAYCSGLATEELLDMLLDDGAADVNFQHGEALKIATRAGNVTLLRKLASCGVRKEALTHAFFEVIVSPLGEDVVLELIDVLTASKEPNNRPDFKATLCNRRPLIFDCLAVHPESVKLVSRLAQLGCDVDARYETRLYSEMESVTALAWSLTQCKGTIPIVSSAAIGALIDSKANVNFKAPLSNATPLILAARYHRGDIVKKLIDAKANTCNLDRLERSALFCASGVGDLDAVKALLKAPYMENDGSLHEAARNLHSDVIEAIIKGKKHDADFPSSRPEHEGRTALQEMLYRCDGRLSITDMQNTILALKKAKADPLAKWQGKTSLFLALENIHPYPVTRALLDTVMWRMINDHANVIDEIDRETGTTFFFSPTVYLKRRSNKNNSVQNQHLLQLLRTKRCVDRYYAEFGADQPSDAVGLPEDIVKEDKRRRDEEKKWHKSEFEHMEKLRRQIEESQSKHEIWKTHESEKTSQKVDQSATLHQTQLEQNEQTTRQQQLASLKKNAIAEQSRARTAMINQEALQREQQLKLDFQDQTSRQKLVQQKGQNVLSNEAAQQKLKISEKTQALKAVENRNMLKHKAASQGRDLQHKTALYKRELAFKKSMQELRHK